MSLRKGPQKVRNRLKAKLQKRADKSERSDKATLATQSTGMSILSIPEVLKDPKSYNIDAKMGAILQKLQENANLIDAIAQKWIAIAKNHQSKERDLNLQMFIGENQLYIQENFVDIIDQLELRLINQRVSHPRMETTLTFFNEKTKEFQRADSLFSLVPTIAYNEKLSPTEKQTETTILSSFANINLWHSLLLYGINLFEPGKKEESVESLKSRIISNLFQDMDISLSMMIQAMLCCQLSQHDYYLYFKMIKDTIGIFIEYADPYQNQLMALIEGGRRDNLKGERIKLDNLMLIYKNAVIFLHCFGLKNEANELSIKFKNNSEKLSAVDKKHIFEEADNKTRKLSEHLKEIGLEISKMRDLAEKIKLHPGLPIFYLLDARYNENSVQEISLQVNAQFDKENFIKDLKQDLKHFGEVNDYEHLMPITESLLNKFSRLRSLSLSEIDEVFLTEISKLVIEWLKMFSVHSCFKNGYVGLASQGVIKQLAGNIFKQLKEAHLKERPIQVNPRVEIHELSEEAMLVEKIDAFSLSTPEINKPDPKEDQTLKEPHQEVDVDLLILKQEDKKLLKEGKLALRARFEENCAHQVEDAARKREAIAKELSQQRQEKLAQVAASHEQELKARANELERKLQLFREKKNTELQRHVKSQAIAHGKALKKLDQEHQTQMQALILAHQAEITEIDRKRSTEIKSLNDKYHSDLYEHKLKLKEEREYLRTQQQEEVKNQSASYEDQIKAFEATLIQEQHTIIQELKEQHQKKLETLRLEFQSKSDEKRSYYKKQQEKAQRQPIASIRVPSQVQFILGELEAAGIECYIVGGFVRNRLLQINLEGEDIDIMVNCTPEDFPEKLKLYAQQNNFCKKQFKMDSIDFWCEPWDDLSVSLQQRDFLLNTFIAAKNGQVYDVLGASSELQTNVIRFIRNPKDSLEKDASLILRLVRFCTQLNRRIDSNDLPVVKEYAKNIRNIPFGILLSNLRELFISPFACQNLDHILSLGLLNDIFVSSHPFKNDILNEFWNRKLQEINANDEHRNYYHILALFLLNPILENEKRQANLEVNVKEVLSEFFSHYPLIDESTKARISKNVEAYLFDCLINNEQHKKKIAGLYDQYKQFEAAYMPIAIVSSSNYLPQSTRQRSGYPVMPRGVDNRITATKLRK